MCRTKLSPLWRHFLEVDGNLLVDTYMLPYILPEATSGEWPVTTVVWLSGGCKDIYEDTLSLFKGLLLQNSSK